MGFIHLIKQSNANTKVEQLVPYIQKGQRILDFGCGDLSLAKAIVHRSPTISVTGVDVIDFGVRDTAVRVKVYDGKKLPYKNKQFDVVISYHVLHHTDNPISLLHECIRVCGKTLLLVEPVFRFRAEIFGMSVMDWLFNVWKDRKISMTYAYKSKREWMRAIESQGLSIIKIVDVEMLPRWFLTGRSYLFVCTKKDSDET